MRDVEVPYRKFHCLRHIHATQLLAVGVPILEVSKRLGQSRPSHTLNLYGHAIHGFDENITQEVDDIFKLYPASTNNTTLSALVQLPTVYKLPFVPENKKTSRRIWRFNF